MEVLRVDVPHTRVEQREEACRDRTADDRTPILLLASGRSVD